MVPPFPDTVKKEALITILLYHVKALADDSSPVPALDPSRVPCYHPSRPFTTKELIFPTEPKKAIRHVLFFCFPFKEFMK
jgi:hypothetical protein